MKKGLFFDIFDREILPFINEMQQNNPLIRMKNMELCKEEIYRAYSDLNTHLKNMIFRDQSADSVLDRHKVAACICAAFLKVSVFYKDEMINSIKQTGERVEAYFFYANELVSFMAGCRFLSFFMTSECAGDREKAERIIREFPVLPPIKKSTASCYNCILFNLSQIKTEEIGLDHFDIYSYSMFFFMLESYYNEQAA